MANNGSIESDSRSNGFPPSGKPATAYDKYSRLQLAVRWFREHLIGRGESSLKEMIEEALEEESDETAEISAEEKTLLKNMIHFGELTVRDIMVPRTEIMAVPRDVSTEDLKRHVIDIGHTRIPVHGDSLDQIDGFIHVKDLFPYIASGTDVVIANVLREILFVPPSMRIVDLLLKMRVSGCHMAIVVDEYGGTSGLVTMEDLFEELVGEIQDEHDEESPERMMRMIGDSVMEADARIKIEQVESALGITLKSEDAEDYDTLGGYIFFSVGRVPVKGEVLKPSDQLKVEILSADPRRIRFVRLTRLHPSV